MSPKLPKSLQTLLDKLRLAIRDLMDSYAEGDVSAIKWRDTMKALLTRFITASFMSGQKSPLIGVAEQGFIYEYVKAQLGFIDNFYLSIVSSPEFQEGWRARAESYTNSLVAPFWKGETKYLALPAMPGDMTTPCGQLCACLWDIQPIDEEAGDYDCYWRLNAARTIETEHCQICEQRSKEWNPLQIRGGELIIPQGEAGKEYIEHIKEHLQIALKGGEGSGNFGHAGRPGEVGGSASSRGNYSTEDIDDVDWHEFRQYDTAGDVEEMRNYSLDWFYGLNDKEIYAINGYTDADFADINSNLRNNPANISDELFEKIDAIDFALYKSEVPEDMVVYRFMENKLNLEIGDTFTDAGFVSTSLRKSSAAHASVHSRNPVRILIPKGNRAAFVYMVSKNPGEEEVLLPRDSEFRVIETLGTLTLEMRNNR